MMDELQPTRKDELIVNQRPLGQLQTSWNKAPSFSPRATVPRVTMADLVKVVNYIGGAGPAVYRKPMDQVAVRATRLNEMKQITLLERPPAPSGIPIAAGEEAISMTTSRIARVNNFDGMMAASMTNQQRGLFGMVRPRDMQPSELRNQRFDPRGELAALRGNPLATSIVGGL
jgi:hypothetical protein